jgi:hypothetical protein
MVVCSFNPWPVQQTQGLLYEVQLFESASTTALAVSLPLCIEYFVKFRGFSILISSFVPDLGGMDLVEDLDLSAVTTYKTQI